MKFLSYVIAVALCVCLFAPITAAASTTTQAYRLPAITKDTELYAQHPTAHTYIGCTLDFWGDALPTATDPQATAIREFRRIISSGLAAMDGLQPSSATPVIASHAFLLWDSAGNRHVYGISAGGQLIADSRVYTLPAERKSLVVALHDALIAQSTTAYTQSEAYPQWLIWMTPQKITAITYHSPTRGALQISSDQQIQEYALQQIRQPVATSGDVTYTPGQISFTSGDTFHLEIKFDTGVVYNIYAKNAKDAKGNYHMGHYYVQSSDIDYGCIYLMDMASEDGPANSLIRQFELIANAKTIKDLDNPSV